MLFSSHLVQLYIANIILFFLLFNQIIKMLKAFLWHGNSLIFCLKIPVVIMCECSGL